MYFVFLFLSSVFLTVPDCTLSNIKTSESNCVIDRNHSRVLIYNLNIPTFNTSSSESNLNRTAECALNNTHSLQGDDWMLTANQNKVRSLHSNKKQKVFLVVLSFTIFLIFAPIRLSNSRIESPQFGCAVKSLSRTIAMFQSLSGCFYIKTHQFITIRHPLRVQHIPQSRRT